ncbi:MAG: hypothetical protein ABSD31_18545 [Candidatus Binataceae bacterium]
MNERAPEQLRDSIAQFAELRGVQALRLHDPGLATEDASGARLLALRWDEWARLSDKSALRLAAQVRSGAVLYFGGGLENGRSYSLRPFSRGLFGTIKCSGSYRLAQSGLIPNVLRGEHFNAGVSMLGACGLDTEVEVIAWAGALPTIFASAHGGGWVIYDLAYEHNAESEHTPIISRLMDPARRARELGSLIAADLAAGRDFAHPGSYNLILDDRPINYDYLSIGRLRRWLDHMRQIAPDFHLDCAWIPSQARPLRRSVEILKEFKAGFVWHGFLDHVDYSQMADPGEHLRRGREMLRLISQRFGVTVRPIMIFPMERRNEAGLRCLRDGGFEAIVEHAEIHPQDEDYAPAYLRYSTPLRRAGSIGFPAMRRYPASEINRGRMTALAALGLPVIAFAHPDNLGLERSPWRPKENPTHLDAVIRFAVEKGLRPTPLTDLFNEMRKLPEPSSFAVENYFS